MKPSQLHPVLLHLATLKQPTFLWGPPGIGKSDLVRQVAKAYGGGFIDMRLPLYDAVDMRGIPVASDGSTKWITPETFPKKGKGVLFLDELVQAAPIVQAAASQLILDRKVGEYTLPDGWAVIAAGNRETDRAATNRMPSHIANRFTHLNFEVDLGDWIDWAFGAGVSPMVIAFLAFKPALLHAFDPKQKAFPTCRSWEKLSNIVNSGLDVGLAEVAAGTVGEGAAIEFVAFSRVFREMPDYDSILRKPGSAQLPESTAARYAVSSMLAHRAQQKDMKALMQYIERMSREFQILTVTEMTRRTPALASTSSYITWASDNKDLLLNATA